MQTAVWGNSVSSVEPGQVTWTSLSFSSSLRNIFNMTTRLGQSARSQRQEEPPRKPHLGLRKLFNTVKCSSTKAKTDVSVYVLVLEYVWNEVKFLRSALLSINVSTNIVTVFMIIIILSRSEGFLKHWAETEISIIRFSMLKYYYWVFQIYSATNSNCFYQIFLPTLLSHGCVVWFLVEVEHNLLTKSVLI